jgi:hypothetical protein
MSHDRTQRFERLLRTHQQLERLAQWRLAAATAARVESQHVRDIATSSAEMARADREALLSAACRPAALHCVLAAETWAESRVREADQAIAARAQIERVQREAAAIAQRKTKQWEKLAGAAREADAAEAAQLQQQQWDEHGLRRHGHPPADSLVPTDSTGEHAAEATS